MNNYTKSFGITLAIYLILAVSFFYSFDTQKTLQSKQVKSEQTVNFTIIQEEKVVKKIIKEKTIEKEKTIQKIVKKETPKKIISKKIKPIEKKVIKNVQKKDIKQAQKKKETKVAKKHIKKNISPTTEKKNSLEDINKRKIHQQRYYTQIKELINQNKYYPKRAVQRGVEGIVEIQFTISKKGELIAFKIVKGKSIFKKSIQSAVEKSFPLKPPQGILSKNTQLSLTIAYNLY